MSESATSLWEIVRQLVLVLNLGGTVPGDQVAPADLSRAFAPEAVFACQWSAPVVPRPGASGWSGALADPEISRALAALRSAAEANAPSESGSEAPSSSSSPHGAWARLAQCWLAHPGCAFVAVGVPDKKARGLRGLLKLGIVIDAGPRANQLVQEMRTTLPAWATAEQDPPSFESTGLLRFRQSGSRLVWGWGSTVDETVARLEGAGGGLESNAGFHSLQQAVGSLDHAHMLWLNVPAPVAQLLVSASDLPESIKESVRSFLGQLGTVRFLAAKGFDEDRLVVRGAMARGPRQTTGFLADQPLDDRAFQRIPADAQLVAAARLDGSRLLASLTPQRRQDIERELGMNFEQDILPAFGSTSVLVSAPSLGSPLGISPVWTLDVRDPQKSYAVFSQAMIWLQRTLPESGRSRMVTEMFDDRMLYTVQSTDNGLWSLAPCFCLTDRELIVGVQPQTVRAYLRFRESRASSWSDRKQNVPWPREASAGLYVDSPALTAQIWPLVPFLAAPTLNRLAEEGWPLDAGIWPSTTALLNYSQPTTGFVSVQKDHVLFELRNPASLAVPLLAAVSIPAWIRAQVSTGEAATDETAMEIDLGAPAGAETPVSAMKSAEPPGEGVQPALLQEDEERRERAIRAAGFLRSITPDDVEGLIPEAAWRRLEQGPTAEELQQRRERRDQRRRERGR